MKFFNVRVSYVFDTGLSSSAIEYTKSKVVENKNHLNFYSCKIFFISIKPKYVHT